MRKKQAVPRFRGIGLLICALLFFGACQNPAGDDGKSPVLVTGVTVTPANPQVGPGETVQLQAAVTPDSATDKTITWTSSASPVASVNSSGLVTGHTAGTAVITATSVDGPKGTVTVTVVSPVQGITLTGQGETITAGTVINIAVGDSPVTISAGVSPAGVDQTVIWTSGNTAVATVNNGVITAVGAGDAAITVTSAIDSAKTITFNVHVAAAPVPINGISLDKTTLSLNRDGTYTLTVAYNPDDTTQRGVTWSSDDETVATVSNGVVHAVGGGTATITATSTADNTKTATCTVNVTVPLTGISLTPNPLDINGIGTTDSFTVTYSPSDTTETGVSWSSSNTAVATVDSDTGEITTAAGGTATITATSTVNSSISGNAVVNVVIPVTGIGLDQTTLNLTRGGLDVTLVPGFTPTNTTQRGVTWSSSDNSVATVSTNGLVHAVGGGTATITATSTADGSISAACTVTVTVPLTGISLTPNPLDINGIGTTDSFTVAYSPPDTTETGVSWSSNNTAVATVSNGTVTAVAGGTTTITATSTVNSSISGNAVVNVVIPVTGIGLDQTTLNLTRGGLDVTLVPGFTPTNTTQRGVTWSSSDNSVATVSTNGLVHAVGGGTATITAASTSNPGISADCTVNVTVPLTGISLPPTLTLGLGSSSFLTVNYTPPDTTQTGVTWSSNNNSVARVDSTTGEITPVAVGNAVITAISTTDGTKTTSCNVTVQASFNGAGINIVFEGLEDQTITLDVTVDGSDQFVITAPAGFDRYLWYMDFDGVSETSNPTVTYSVFYVTPGRHYITVIVEEDGYHFSKTLAYTVGY